MTERAKLKVAVIGLGWVAQNRHIPTMLKNPRFRIVGVIDKRPDRARDVAAANRIGLHAEVDNLTDVPWLDEVDAVVIGSAPFCHYRLAAEALELSMHVLTEKPFTMEPAEADDLIARRDKAGRQLCVVHNFQFARSTRRLLADVEAGRIGEIRSLSAVQLGNPRRRLPTWHEELPLGLFYDESPHLLYLLKRLAPSPLSFEQAQVHGSTAGARTPASVTAHYSYAAGDIACPATLSLNFESPLSEWYLMVHGTERLGIVDIFRDIYITLPNDGAHVASTILRTSALATWQHWAQTVTSGIRHFTGRLSYGNDIVFGQFASAALDGERAFGMEAEDARDVQRMQQQIIDRAIWLGNASEPPMAAAGSR